MPKPTGDQSPPPARYFLASDNDGHYYLVEAARRAELEAWLALDGEEDERAWDPPAFARPIGGSPVLITFTDPRIGDA